MDPLAQSLFRGVCTIQRKMNASKLQKLLHFSTEKTKIVSHAQIGILNNLSVASRCFATQAFSKPEDYKPKKALVLSKVSR